MIKCLHPVRHGEGLRIATERLNAKNFYAVNPSFDCGGACICDRH